MILHKISYSPFEHQSLQQCLRFIRPDDAILLCQDAVYSLQSEELLAAMTSNNINLFALQEDLAARGIEPKASVTQVDYSGFVDLTLKFDKVMSW